MKVSEAKNKVCPFIQHTYGQNEVQNINCICGDCMAWEFTSEKISPSVAICTICNKESLDSDSCMSCGEDFLYEHFIDMHEEEKEGYCRRLYQ